MDIKPTSHKLPWTKVWWRDLDDPKFARLSDRLWRRTQECRMLCAKQAEGGLLPDVAIAAWTLHADQEAFMDDLLLLEGEGILSREGERWRFVNWERDQARKDPTGPQRQERHREKVAAEAHRYMHVTSRVTSRVDKEQDKEQDNRQEPVVASAVASEGLEGRLRKYVLEHPQEVDNPEGYVHHMLEHGYEPPRPKKEKKPAFDPTTADCFKPMEAL